jgi:nicotinate-nucleotide adenylyltransferase
LKRIGFLGGSFDPPHYGHVMLALLSLARNDVEKVLAVPCLNHPFGKELQPFDHRFEMTRLAFERFKDLIEISDIEYRLKGVSKTFITLEQISKKSGKDVEIFTLIGSDILKEKHKWYRVEEIERKYPFIVIPRGKNGFYIPDIKSSQIRSLIRKDKGIKDLLPPKVYDYIIKNGLYT